MSAVDEIQYRHASTIGHVRNPYQYYKSLEKFVSIHVHYSRQQRCDSFMAETR